MPLSEYLVSRSKQVLSFPSTRFYLSIKVYPSDYFMPLNDSSWTQDDTILHCDWLPERARQRHLSCPLEITCRDPQIIVFFFYIINPLLTKLVRSNKKELGQYPAILTEQAWSITHISKLTTPDWKALSLHEEPSTSGGSFSCHKTLKKNQSAYKYFDMSKENKTKKNTFTLPLYFFTDQRRLASADTSLRYCRESVRI